MCPFISRFWSLYIHFPESQKRMSAKVNYWPSKKDFKYVKNKLKLKWCHVSLCTILSSDPTGNSQSANVTSPDFQQEYEHILFGAVTSKAETIRARLSLCLEVGGGTAQYLKAPQWLALVIKSFSMAPSTCQKASV